MCTIIYSFCPGSIEKINWCLRFALRVIRNWKSGQIRNGLRMDWALYKKLNINKLRGIKHFINSL